MNIEMTEICPNCGNSFSLIEWKAINEKFIITAWCGKCGVLLIITDTYDMTGPTRNYSVPKNLQKNEG